MTAPYVHPLALCETTVGDGTRVWPFAHVLPGATIGVDCNICEHVFVENDAVVGDRVTVKCGVQLWDGVTLEDDVFVGPNATFTNDPHPRSRQPRQDVSRTIVRRGASIGANATILPGIEIGPVATVGAGAVVTRDVPAGATVVGNPARPLAAPSGPRLVWTKIAADERGQLLALELDGMPFTPRRIFVVSDVPAVVRGEHAHRECEQILLCLRGSVTCTVERGEPEMQQFRLGAAPTGLYLPPLVWAEQHDFSEDALLLVLASHPYDPGDYIRDRNDLRLLKGSG